MVHRAAGVRRRRRQRREHLDARLQHPVHQRLRSHRPVRTGIFACVCPAPFFNVVQHVEPGASLSFRYAVTFADGDTGPDGAARIAKSTTGITTRIQPLT